MKKTLIAVACLAAFSNFASALPYGYSELMERLVKVEEANKSSIAKDVILAQSTTNVESSGRATGISAQPSPKPLANPPDLTLYPGEVKVMAIPKVERIAIGNGKLLTATIVDEKQVVLLGEAKGQTTMYLWLKNGTQKRYEVTVAGENMAAKAADELGSILKIEPKVKVSLVNERVVLTGDYSSAESAEKVKRISSLYPEVLNLINERPLGFEVPQAKMVLMEVKVIEVRKSAVDKLGIDWNLGSINGPQISNDWLLYSNSNKRPALPDSFGPASPARPFLSFIGMAGNITSMLNFLESNGDSWVLSEPRVSTVSGGASTVQVGGEIPIPISTGFGGVAVEYKKYGVILKIEPIVDDKGNIRSKIVAEVSRPDGSTGSGQYTTFSTNRTETEVSMVEGETLIISGLLQNKGDGSQSGVKGLQDVPVLGRLFSNRAFGNDRTEMMVVVTPRIHIPGSNLATKMMQEADRAIENVQMKIEKRVRD
jgi:pilus assembly protein CpaC